MDTKRFGLINEGILSNHFRCMYTKRFGLMNVGKRSNHFRCMDIKRFGLVKQGISQILLDAWIPNGLV